MRRYHFNHLKYSVNTFTAKTKFLNLKLDWPSNISCLLLKNVISGCRIVACLLTVTMCETRILLRLLMMDCVTACIRPGDSYRRWPCTETCWRWTLEREPTSSYRTCPRSWRHHARASPSASWRDSRSGSCFRSATAFADSSSLRACTDWGS